MNYGAGRPHLSFEQIESVCVPLPPEAEQEQIVGHIEQVFQSMQIVVAAFHLRAQSTAQRKNILRAAFSGQLVAQDPNEEPASALLARIRTERASIEKSPRIKRESLHRAKS